MTYEEFLITLSDITSEQAYRILKENLDHEFKKGYELIISKNAECSFIYAKLIGRFELGENSISKDAFYSYLYAYEVIQGRFELGENAISENARYSYYYAKYVIQGRFESGEEVIKNSNYKSDYAINVMKDPDFWCRK